MTIRPKAVLVVEDINCDACKGTGYEPGHEPTLDQKPYRWCPTCHGAKVRHRAMPLEDFAKLFTWGHGYDEVSAAGLKAPDNEIRVRAPNESEEPK